MKKFLLIFCLTAFLFGSNGKISGLVSQKSNDEPAIGVNIVLVDSYIGAATDENGRFTILNVPPGTYTLRADAIGFAPVVMQNVRVTTSQTTEISIKLEDAVVEGQEVNVIAERPLVQKDLTASQRVTTAKEIQDMPVESFLGVLATHAGVNQSAGGALHVRGGRSNEVGYFIDGVSVSNPFFTNSLAVSVSNKALEEMKLVSGAFNAEYGNAKKWPLNHWIDLANLYNSNYNIIFLGKDISVNENIKERCKSNSVKSFIGKTNLNDVVNLLSIADLVVSNDSGLMHIAGAVNCKIIALYGSSSPFYTPPLISSDSGEVIYKNLDCSPCFERECPLKHLNCLREISAQEVFKVSLNYIL